MVSTQRKFAQHAKATASPITLFPQHEKNLCYMALWPSARWKRWKCIISCVDRTAPAPLLVPHVIQRVATTLASRHRVAQNFPSIRNASRATRSQMTGGIFFFEKNKFMQWFVYFEHSEEDDQTCLLGRQDLPDCLRHCFECPRFLNVCARF